ncbi:hypothetical protein GQ53DRAFT_749547 [Thozetella sp. PMI_491]|nr:hypothetical protein GQ53DRAFT_749547 [Thozetella sp. PMI_491]
MMLPTVASTLLFTSSALGATLATRAVWQPAVGTSWQIILSGSLKLTSSSTSVTPNVDVFDIDLFTNTKNGVDTTVIDALHRLNKKVICYFSAGSYEPGRPDSSQFAAADKGNELDGWPGEYWLNLNSQNVRNIMAARIALAAKMGCDAVDPDNVDGYGENGGKNGAFTIKQADSISFVKFLATEAQKNNIAIGLKNAAEIIDDVLSVVQFSVNEECVAVKECSTFLAFTDASKPVFHIEYPNGDDGSSRTPVSDTTGWCQKEKEDDNKTYDITKFSTVIKNMDLDGWVQLCDKSTAVSPTN